MLKLSNKFIKLMAKIYTKKCTLRKNENNSHPEEHENQEKNHDKLFVKIYCLEDNRYVGKGFDMPSQEFFENEYVPKYHPQAKKIGDGKYQIDDYKYIVCEEG